MKTRRVLIGIGVLGAIASVAVIAVTRMWTSSWEKSLKGPFFGAEVSAHLEISESSTLLIPGKNVVLSVSETNSIGGVILTLRSLQGDVSWSRLLNASNEIKRLKSVQLLSVSESGRGYKVRIMCEWDMGREGGIIYLEPNLSFKCFALSW